MLLGRVRIRGMMADQLLIEGLAEEFWSLTGIVPDYPCDMEYAALAAFALPTVAIEALDIAKARGWAQRYAIPIGFPTRNRPLCGCLLANARAGVILIDATDPPDEQRYTIAHESSHFLLECWRPLRQAEEAFGKAIIDVLEGRRLPTLDERLEAMLNDLPLRLVGHLMERPETGLPTVSVLDAEDRADRLALELLAPLQRLVELMRQSEAPRGYRSRLSYLEGVLCDVYGVPADPAMAYSKYILKTLGEPTFRDWLADDL